MSENTPGGAPASAAPTSVTPDTSSDSLESTESEGEGLEGESSEPAPAAKAATPAEKKRNIKKLKLKIDGKDIEEDFDMDDEASLIKHLQMSKVSQKRMAESAQLQKEVEHFVNELKKNPRKILSDPNIGIDIKQLAAEIIEAEIENSKKTPDQLEREKLMSELESLKSERQREAEEMKNRELTAMQERAFQDYDMKMTKALEKHTDLPKSPYVVKKMADYLLLGLKEGMDIQPDDVVELVREEMRNDLKEMFAVLPEDVIEQLVGKDKINGIRKKNLAKAKAPATPSQVKDTGRTGEKAPAGEKQSFKSFFNKR
jgi:hypothetical protein